MIIIRPTEETVEQEIDGQVADHQADFEAVDDGTGWLFSYVKSVSTKH